MKRVIGLDLVRCIAILFVPAVHFFLNSGFYDIKINGWEMFVLSLFRWLFYLGVPLFILLTGYLKRNSQLDKKYYRRIISIIISYIFISIICVLFKKLYLGEQTRILSMIVSIFNFTGCKYAWYIEMYIGLFLLIPFLNILYNSLETKKKKQYLIITLIILCSISPIINYLKIDNVKLELIPNWWNQIYPLIYYFIGCYISEYQIKINKKKGIFLFLIILVLETIISFLYNYNHTFSWDFLGGYNSIQIIIISTILFLLLYNIKINNKKIVKILTNISMLSLDIYLFSYIVDLIMYTNINEYLKTTIQYLKYMFLIIPIVFIISYILAYIKKIIFDIVKKIIN